MREIKFRAWDKKRKRIYHFDLGRFVMEGCGDKTRIIVWVDEATSMENNLPKGGNTENDFYIIMQYTGLKDKNGKEIYEGDIVNLIPDGYKITEAIVKWHESCWVYCRVHTNTNIRVTDVPVEVIGNIYENPRSEAKK